MLIYENERSQSVVQRLVALGSTVRIMVTAICVILFTSPIVQTVDLLVNNQVVSWLGGIAGAAIAYALGTYLSALLVTILEWMAQLLVAQGEILAALEETEEG